MEVMALKMTSIQYYLIQTNQPFQNSGRLNSCGGCNFRTDWWILMKFCKEAMALKMTLTPYYLPL
jgi:hypothetical protein